ncbi:cytochrome C oxidase copper chaperone-domain-containing protein [Flagelloscypha sp. PMI_526]|nr:cytochrome C oxidase copper chaperone-domain-containing protein [Flagelloscypha sp. PMI_526]
MLDKVSSWWYGPSKPYDATDPKQNPLNPEGLKPCCACPETKAARDGCFLREGPYAEEKCTELVQKHLACMRGLGFKI